LLAPASLPAPALSRGAKNAFGERVPQCSKGKI
jgi:hypothetical protein